MILIGSIPENTGSTPLLTSKGGQLVEHLLQCLWNSKSPDFVKEIMV